MKGQTFINYSHAFQEVLQEMSITRLFPKVKIYLSPYDFLLILTILITINVVKNVRTDPLKYVFELQLMGQLIIQVRLW